MCGRIEALSAIPRRRAGLLGAAGLVSATLPARAQNAVPPSPGWRRTKVGGFAVTTLFDGSARFDLNGFVTNVPVERVRAALAESFLPPDHYRSIYTIPVVDTGRTQVMFDVGTGGQLAPTAGQLAANMQAAGLDPARIGIVVLTHFHGDHITGLTTRDNQPVFPNAEIVVPAAEWRFWTDRGNETRVAPGQRGHFANTARRFGPYAGRIRQVEDGQEVTPGIRAVATPGHTPGHMSFLVADGSAQLMVLGDVTHRPELFARHPGMHIGLDVDPVLAEATRRRVLDRMVADRLRVTGYHHPFPALGYFERAGDGYRFVLEDWTS
jgi:glyoxylase-like metal-dependent hydrolase (beta-lactamase superfamily II)